MKKLVKEPLVHFLLIGMGIFLLYALVEEDTPDDSRIVIDDGQLNHLVTMWEAQWQRPPTEVEMAGLMQRHIRQEVFYREALRMNLDHDDEMVKRRLSQKMEFLSDDLSSLIDPATEKKLRSFYEENEEDYRSPPRYSFHQVAFTSKAPATAQALLIKHASASPQALQGKGDMLSLPFTYDQLYENHVGNQLGGELAAQLDDLPLNKWTGPVQSGYGTHLVYITEKEESFLPKFEDIKAELTRDYEYRSEKESQEMIFDELKANYEVVIQADLTQSLRERLLANFQ